MKLLVFSLFLLYLGWSESAIASRTANCPSVFCFVHCDTGYLTDANGCPSCSCRPNPTVQQPACDDLRCFIPCLHGYRVDSSTNCMTCDCAPNTVVAAVNHGVAAATTNACNNIFCLLPCANGYENDANGCPTCVCRANSAFAESKQLPQTKQLPEWFSSFLTMVGGSRK